MGAQARESRAEDAWSEEGALEVNRPASSSSPVPPLPHTAKDWRRYEWYVHHLRSLVHQGLRFAPALLRLTEHFGTWAFAQQSPVSPMTAPQRLDETGIVESICLDDLAVLEPESTAADAWLTDASVKLMIEVARQQGGAEKHYIAFPADVHRFAARHGERGVPIDSEATVRHLRRHLADADAGRLAHSEYPASTMSPGTRSVSIIYNVLDRHWVHVLLRVGAGVRRGEIFLHDSTRQGGRRVARSLDGIHAEIPLLARLISMRPGSGWQDVLWPNQAVGARCPQQSNGSDCAVLAVQCAQQCMKGRAVDESALMAEDGQQMGERLRSELIMEVADLVTPRTSAGLDVDIDQIRENLRQAAEQSRATVNPVGKPRWPGKWAWLENGVDDKLATLMGFSDPSEVAKARQQNKLPGGTQAKPCVCWFPDLQYLNPSRRPTGPGTWHFVNARAAELAQLQSWEGSRGQRVQVTASDVWRYREAQASMLGPSDGIDIIWAPQEPDSNTPQRIEGHVGASTTPAKRTGRRGLAATQEVASEPVEEGYLFTAADKALLLLLRDGRNMSWNGIHQQHFQHTTQKRLRDLHWNLKERQTRQSDLAQRLIKQGTPHLTTSQEGQLMTLKRGRTMTWHSISVAVGRSKKDLQAWHKILKMTELQDTKRRKSANSRGAVCDADQSGAEEDAALSRVQAAMFFELPEWARVNGQGIYRPYFPYDPAPNFGPLESVFENWKTASAVAVEVKMPILSLGTVLTFVGNEHASGVNGAVGKLRHCHGFGLGDTVLYAAETWHPNEVEEYRQQSASQRMKLCGAGVSWTWMSVSTPTLRILPVVTEDTSSDTLHECSFVVDRVSYEAAESGSTAGLALMLCMPEAVVLTDLQDAIACLPHHGTGIECTKGPMKGTMWHMTWSFDLESQRYREWARGKSLSMKDGMTDKWMMKLRTILHESAGNPYATWGAVFDRLFPGS
ncbi:hypothetical protein LTR53_001013 [Teratosphaeriaceae sp. CCFEE 6253]|nr:hypothetical protein LTR53_001013 [Teratosphaeriaceae sp. CCFEE 6253]